MASTTTMTIQPNHAAPTGPITVVIGDTGIEFEVLRPTTICAIKEQVVKELLRMGHPCPREIELHYRGGLACRSENISNDNRLSELPEQRLKLWAREARSTVDQSTGDQPNMSQAPQDLPNDILEVLGNRLEGRGNQDNRVFAKMTARVSKNILKGRGNQDNRTLGERGESIENMLEGRGNQNNSVTATVGMITRNVLRGRGNQDNSIFGKSGKVNENILKGRGDQINSIDSRSQN
ncbi:hypothetical protein Dda_4747 [Drechslerella dactyloides]|uniref:Ubiquitin-like domain-containing protein n=1 Tax=Drechslerella dactyloides TaxID=74499 RepID=A0AAD6J1R6_DREDA|nr:hypothetical protein Dda_4747 [Drechslerella dactyloides]